MPYPSKTDRRTILAAAVECLTDGDIRSLSLRSIATSLKLAPNALYRYFPERAALEAALADECASQLEVALRNAADEPIASKAIRRMASAYIQFAKHHHYLYEVMMSFHCSSYDASSRHSLWVFTVEQVERLAGKARAKEATVALWALLHGAVTLEAIQVLGDEKPASGLEFGLKAWMVTAEATAPLALPRSLDGRQGRSRGRLIRTGNQ